MFPGVLASAEATTPLACSQAFPGTAAQVREARRFLAEFLNDYPAVDDAVVCLSELVTNAVIHSNSGKPDGAFTVSAEVSVGGLRVEVRDQGGAWAHPGHRDDHAHGRGLLIVSELALAWGRAGDPVSGWTVWFEIECHAPERQPSAGGAGQRWIVVLDGRRLRQLRGKHGLSQAGLAGRAGVSVSVISRLERQARATCRSRTLARLAAALGEEPAVLASGPDSSDHIQPD